MTMGGRTSRGAIAELRRLSLAPAPVLAMLVAIVVFDHGAFDLGALGAAVDAAAPVAEDIDTMARLHEGAARIKWIATVLLFYFAAVATTVASVQVMRESMTRGAWKCYVAVGAVLALAALAYGVYSEWARSPYGNVFHFTFDRLKDSGRFDATHLSSFGALVNILNVLAVIVPPLVLVATCSAMGPCRVSASELDEVQTQMKRLKNMLNVCSALLVCGILHMVAWLRWPAVLVVDPNVAARIHELAASVGLFWGASYSIVIISLFVPASLILNRRAEALLANTPKGEIKEDAITWLEKRGFWASPLARVSRVGVMLAPLLAGPVGSALGNLASPFG